MQTVASRALNALDAVFELVGSKTKGPQWPDQSGIWVHKTTTVTTDDNGDQGNNVCTGVVIQSSSQSDTLNERVVDPLHVVSRLHPSSICSQTQVVTPIQFPAHLPLEILTMILLLALPPIPDLVTYWTTPLEYILLEGIIADFWKRRGDISRVCRRWRDALKSQCQILPVPHYSMTDTTLNEIQAIILDRAATFSMALPSGRRGPRVDFGMLQDAQDIMGVSWQRLVAFVLQQRFDFSNANAVHQFFGYDAPELRRLYLTGSSTVVQVVPGSIFNGNAPQLRELVLDFCVVCPQAPFVGNLTHLCIQCTANANETAVYDVLHAAKALEHLSLLWALSDRGDASSLDATPLRLPTLRHLRIGGDGRLGGTFNLFSRLKASSDLDVEVLWYRFGLDMTVDDVSKVRKDLWEMFMWWRVDMEVDEVVHQLASSGESGMLVIQDVAQRGVPSI
ncbi:hypothetical protein HGRIS_004839 [Hohenbuehelia grisea]|uniref:F-box domain-containing protein n=1 Tax=Hohenbuehelia grisea TaxID=104357 RepID=A0ABR3JDC4_9AGAR